MIALGVSVFYVAIILVPFTMVLIVRRVCTEVEIPVTVQLEQAQQARVKTGLASEPK